MANAQRFVCNRLLDLSYAYLKHSTNKSFSQSHIRNSKHKQTYLKTIHNLTNLAKYTPKDTP